jgi:hypothetical protein
MGKNYEKIDKHIYRQFHKYKIRQNNKVLGSFNTEEEARKAHAKLLHDGVIQEKKRGRPISKGINRYISFTKNGTYRIQKCVDGVKCYFGTFKTLENAQQERDYLESIDWDYDNME